MPAPVKVRPAARIPDTFNVKKIDGAGMMNGKGCPKLKMGMTAGSGCRLAPADLQFVERAERGRLIADLFRRLPRYPRGK
jgi:hypothetical protein